MYIKAYMFLCGVLWTFFVDFVIAAVRTYGQNIPPAYFYKLVAAMAALALFEVVGSALVLEGSRKHRKPRQID